MRTLHVSMSAPAAAAQRQQLHMTGAMCCAVCTVHGEDSIVILDLLLTAGGAVAGRKCAVHLPGAAGGSGCSTAGAAFVTLLTNLTLGDVVCRYEAPYLTDARLHTRT